MALLNPSHVEFVTYSAEGCGFLLMNWETETRVVVCVQIFLMENNPYPPLFHTQMMENCPSQGNWLCRQGVTDDYSSSELPSWQPNWGERDSMGGLQSGWKTGWIVQIVQTVWSLNDVVFFLRCHGTMMFHIFINNLLDRKEHTLSDVSQGGGEWGSC